MRTALDPKPANFTRYSKDLVAKFVRERRYHLIPLYSLLRLSDFAREGIEHSGSYRFADHMYCAVPSGRGWIGRCLDAILLKLPATRSMRQRYFASRDALCAAFDAHLHSGATEPFQILTVPCGLPRDVRDFAAKVAQEAPAALSQIKYMGIDLDPEVIEAARVFLRGSAIREPELKVGNALVAGDYPANSAHIVASTGLGEFLDDSALATFYQNVFDALAPGGMFFTSAAAQGRGSEVLLRAFELEVHYRTRADVERILSMQSWDAVEITHDTIGLQTFVRAVKGRTR